MTKLTRSQSIFVGSMLFGMLFGAGNLIFPVHMGQLAGSHFWPANWGFISTGVFMPVIALIAVGISGADSVQQLADRVHPVYSRIFTLLLYLTIGPCFALPRTASVSFQVGVAPFVSPENAALVMGIFTAVFMLLALLMALRPSRLVDYIGKFLNPAFLIFLSILVLVALLHPMGDFSRDVPQGAYAAAPYLTGFKEGYNTMDVLAVIAFAVVVIQSIRRFGVEDRVAMARDIFRVGLIVMALMTVIYTAITWLGAASMGQLAVAENGGIALAEIAQYYFGPLGVLLQAVIVTLACLKTAVGLVSSCSEAFAEAFPHSFGYTKYCFVMAPPALLLACGSDLPGCAGGCGERPARRDPAVRTGWCYPAGPQLPASVRVRHGLGPAGGTWSCDCPGPDKAHRHKAAEPGKLNGREDCGGRCPGGSGRRCG